MKLRAYCDGASRIHKGSPAACAFAVFKDGQIVQSYAEHLGQKTNNFAEYMGLIRLLDWLSFENLNGADIYCDSQLVVNQVNGEWQVKHDELKPLNAKAKYLKNTGMHHLYWVRGHNGEEGNELVDKFCNEILDKEADGSLQKLEAVPGSEKTLVQRWQTLPRMPQEV